MTQLVELYGVEDEDGLPINFDLLEVLEAAKDKRPDFLKEKLAECPKGACVACVACVGLDLFFEAIESASASASLTICT